MITQHALPRTKPRILAALAYAGVTAVALVAPCRSAWAADLPAAYFHEVVFSNADQPTHANSVAGVSDLLPESVADSFTATNGNGSSFLAGMATTTGGSVPTLSLTASSSNEVFSMHAYAEVRYSVRLTGGPAGTSIPMMFEATGSAQSGHSSGGNWLSRASTQLYINGAPQNDAFLNAYFVNGDPGNETASFSINKLITMQVGSEYSVDMIVAATGTNGTASAAMDPTFSFVNASDASSYRLEFSPGLVSAVPEPTGASLLLLGLGGVLVARRRELAVRGTQRVA
ncbi:MAG TPA: PEP-CTERM sorting domain-containing protein [Pseudoduganella sp.]|jgi:hypothetical protein